MPLTTIGTLLITETIKAAAKPTFDQYIKPNQDLISKWLKEKKLNKKIDLFESEFINYVGSLYMMTEHINVLIFPGGANLFR